MFKTYSHSDFYPMVEANFLHVKSVEAVKGIKVLDTPCLVYLHSTQMFDFIMWDPIKPRQPV